jgi:hypothetical protein
MTQDKNEQEKETMDEFLQRMAELAKSTEEK